MTQYNLPTINPASNTGTDLATFLNAWEPALLSAHRGTSRPLYAVTGMIWIDSTGTPTAEQVKLYDGTQDHVLFTINITANTVTLDGAIVTKPTGDQETIAVNGATKGLSVGGTTASPKAYITGDGVYSSFDSTSLITGLSISRKEESARFLSKNASASGIVLIVEEGAGSSTKMALVVSDNAADVSSGSVIGHTHKFTVSTSGNVKSKGKIEAENFIHSDDKVEGLKLISTETNGANNAIEVSNRFTVKGNGDVYRAGTDNFTSDERVKENIRDLSYGLDAVNSLKTHLVDYKDAYNETRKNEPAFIAQELQAIIPEVVGEMDVESDLLDDNKLLVYRDAQMTPILVNAIQELSAKVDTLQSELAALKGAK